MQSKFLPALVVVLSAATTVLAQTNISGMVKCGKPDEQHALEVGDRPNHSLTIAEGKCTWTKPLEIAGTKSKDDIGTGFGDVTGNKSQEHGYVVGTWANGDKSFVRTQGSAVLKSGTIESADGTSSFTGGTGKLKGIKGKGTYKGTGAPDGTVTYEVEGEYKLPK
jgi:hypothetical protein